MKVLSLRFPGALLTNYYEESGSDVCGVTVAKDGVLRDFCETMSQYREPFIRKEFPNLDALLAEEEQELDEFFCENCEFGEFFNFICDAQESLVNKMIHQVVAEAKEIHPCLSGSGI